MIEAKCSPGKKEVVIVPKTSLHSSTRIIPCEDCQHEWHLKYQKEVTENQLIADALGIKVINEEAHYVLITRYNINLSDQNLPSNFIVIKCECACKSDLNLFDINN